MAASPRPAVCVDPQALAGKLTAWGGLDQFPPRRHLCTHQSGRIVRRRPGLGLMSPQRGKCRPEPDSDPEGSARRAGVQHFADHGVSGSRGASDHCAGRQEFPPFPRRFEGAWEVRPIGRALSAHLVIAAKHVPVASHAGIDQHGVQHRKPGARSGARPPFGDHRPGEQAGRPSEPSFPGDGLQLASVRSASRVSRAAAGRASVAGPAPKPRRQRQRLAQDDMERRRALGARRSPGGPHHQICRRPRPVRPRRARDFEPDGVGGSHRQLVAHVGERHRLFKA